MAKKRRRHSPELKAQVGLDALKRIKPVNTMAVQYQIHPVQVSRWKQELAMLLPELFPRKLNGDMEEIRFLPPFSERFGENKLPVPHLIRAGSNTAKLASAWSGLRAGSFAVVLNMGLP
ncbi:MAG: hypothetical protein RL077_5232 [Verrucomicrobiota bacterium]|jgi:transposase